MSSSRRDLFSRVAIAALGTTLVVSIAANVWLSRRQARQLSGSTLAVGAAMPILVGSDLDGRVQTIDLHGSDRPTVVYVFAPDCIWCTRNRENLKALVAGSRSRYRFVGLCLSNDAVELGRYARDQGLDFPVFARLAGEQEAMRRLASTPQTLVVSTAGIVVRSWAGAYTSTNAAEVESYFQLKLPGLAMGG